MKGVVLAGGFGTRLDPLTRVLNKHLLPVYDRPMIYYPLECLARSGIRDVLVLAGGHNAGDMVQLLGDGRPFGLRLQHGLQARAGGIAYALALAEAFAEDQPIVLMLGDNIVQYTLEAHIRQFAQQRRGGRILLTRVTDPSAFGVAEVDGGEVVRLVEKPDRPAGNLAVTGIYFYDQQVFQYIRTLKPSCRQELEITDLNNAYLHRGQLRHGMLSGWWLDAGESIDGYLAACNLVAREGANHTAPQQAPAGLRGTPVSTS